ncbi:transposase [Methylobacterium sp.]|uniref:transposase n=1 Tax=Methylobacterium sp. TaxID=409 RepID=UPI002580A53F|nr:transposase [Methylobacterium sp.]
MLGRGQWDVDAARDLVRTYAAEALADPVVVLVVNETGFVKKGAHSVGVARQYSGTAGRMRTARSACLWPMPAATARR